MWGTLLVENRDNAIVTLRSVCVSVKPGGKILAGTPEVPFAGSLEFLLSGDELTESAWCGGLKGKQFDVGGELALYGDAPKGDMWTTLRSTAEIGAQALFLKGRMDFQVSVLPRTFAPSIPRRLLFRGGDESTSARGACSFVEVTVHTALTLVPDVALLKGR